MGSQTDAFEEQYRKDRLEYLEKKKTDRWDYDPKVDGYISVGVDHPAHYNTGELEVIDCVEGTLSPDEYLGFVKGNIIKYVTRAGHKGDVINDMEKLIWYARRYVDWLKKKRGEK